MKARRFTALLVLLVIGAAIAINVWGKGGDVIVLGDVETREYQGTDLSSFNDFRENSIEGSQYIDIGQYQLRITGLVDEELALSYDEALEGNLHYEKVVTLYCVEGWQVTILWEGIMLEELFELAGVQPEATAIIFYAYDGYSTSLPLDYVLENGIMIAYQMNGVTLPPERGYPFQLVAESKWGYKWIKWITEIELSDNDEYEGYWESHGYSDDGDLGESFFD